MTAWHGEVVGYVHCRICDGLTPTAVAERTGKLCEGCIERGLAPKPLMLVRVSHETVPMKPRRVGKSSKGSNATRAKTRAAKEAAMKRLRDAFPDLYRLLYAEERARRGLPAVPLLTPKFDEDARDRALRVAGERFAIDAIYAALADAGIEEP